MGKEYKISCKNFNQKASLQFVQRRFLVVAHVGSLLQLALQDAGIGSTYSALAPVSLAFESEGFYFCDNLSSPLESALIFKQLIDFLLSIDNDIRIVEL